jgi:cell division protein FtsB
VGGFQRQAFMSTRLKRPSFWRQLLLSGVLVAIQGYLAYNVVSGQFGIEGQRQLEVQIGELSATSAVLAAEVEAYRHRAALFTPQRLDPDIVAERARALLSMAQPDDVIIMIDPTSGKPIRSSFDALAAEQLTDNIEDGID